MAKCLGLLGLLLCTLLPLSVPAQSSPSLFHAEHAAMGTRFTMDLYAPDQGTADRWSSEAFDEVDRLEALLSNYQPTSELSRISREAGEHPVTTDPETFAFLQRALHWSRLSHGAFDLTIGPAMRAWGFKTHQPHRPSAAEVALLRRATGWQRIRLDPATRTVAFTTRPPMELDPGSIGKGFAVDRVVALLHRDGVTQALLSAGGSTLYGIGAPPGKAGWPVEIPDPRTPHTLAATVLLRDNSLSTGACDQKYVVLDGHRYCHIFDPRTLTPMEGVLQATVVSPSATDSDALSTVIFVQSPAETRALLHQLPHTGAILFTTRPGQPSCVAIHMPQTDCIPGRLTVLTYP